MENPEKWIFIEGIILQFGDKNHLRYIFYEVWTLEIMINKIVNDLSAKMLSSPVLIHGTEPLYTWLKKTPKYFRSISSYNTAMWFADLCGLHCNPYHKLQSQNRLTFWKKKSIYNKYVLFSDKYSAIWHQNQLKEVLY